MTLAIKDNDPLPLLADDLYMLVVVSEANEVVAAVHKRSYYLWDGFQINPFYDEKDEEFAWKKKRIKR